MAELPESLQDYAAQIAPAREAVREEVRGTAHAQLATAEARIADRREGSETKGSSEASERVGKLGLKIIEGVRGALAFREGRLEKALDRRRSWADNNQGRILAVAEKHIQRESAQSGRDLSREIGLHPDTTDPKKLTRLWRHTGEPLIDGTKSGYNKLALGVNAVRAGSHEQTAGRYKRMVEGLNTLITSERGQAA